MQAAPPDSATADATPERSEARGWWLGCAQVLVTVCFLSPLILGDRTLFFRDVGNFHWPVKLEQARAWNSGQTPHVDLWRGGGQPGIGNPNTTALYPSNGLLRGRDPDGVLWGFNAHFWLHLLLAPVLVAGWLRALGLRGAAPWVGAATFGGGGFVVSTLGFHNLVAYAVWIPALLWSVATAVTARSSGHAALATVGVSLSWALMLLAGDPSSALLGLLAAGATMFGVGRSGWSRAHWPLLALVPGCLIAGPQIAALLGTLDGSMRGALGYSAEGVLRGSWHPMLGLDLLFPFALGFPDGGFWGARFHGGAQPLIFTFFPGVAAILLCVVGALSSGGARRRLGLALVGTGGLVALGGFNPIMSWLARSGGLSWLRFPVKAWWWVALGSALLAAIAIHRAAESPTVRRRLRRLCGAVGAAWLALAVLFVGRATRPPAWLERWVDHPLGAQVVESSLHRQAASAALGGLAVLGLVWALRRPTRGRWAVWIALFVSVQLASLRPLFPMLEAEEVTRPVVALSGLSADARVVHGPLDLGWSTPTRSDRETMETAADQQRRLNRLGVPMVGVTSGARYLLNTSPDGLDSYLPGAVRRLLRQAPRREQLRLLPRLGATHVVAPGASGSMELVAVGGVAGPVFSSRWVLSSGIADTLGRLSAEIDGEPERDGDEVDDSPPELIVVADDLGEALAGWKSLQRPGPGPRPPGPGLRLVENSASGARLEVDAARDGWLMLDRAWLPRYRATVDGVPVQTTVANALRLAVPVPAGFHRIEVRYDTRSWDARWWFVGSGLVLLLLLAYSRLRRDGSPAR